MSKYEVETLTIDKPNRNGHIYSKSCVEKMVKELNERQIPILAGYDYEENAIDMTSIIGHTKVGSAKLINGTLFYEISINDLHPQVALDVAFKTNAKSFTTRADDKCQFEKFHSIFLSEDDDNNFNKIKRLED